jgi:hypothetical protein
MNASRRLALAAVTAALMCSTNVSAQSTPSPAGSAAPAAAPAPASTPPKAPPVPPLGELKPLGKDRFQIGRIVLDKRAGSFTVPGRVHVMGRPLEYLATTPGGMKEYEALLELDTSGSEFNLACILLGLERDPKQGQFYQFSEAPLVGPRVTLEIAWNEGGKRRTVTAAAGLLDAAAGVAPESVEWVYTGSSSIQPSGQFAADMTGTLVGFVHDANSIIESVRGLGIGAYGSVNGNEQVLPPVGTPVELILTLPRPGR